MSPQVNVNARGQGTGHTFTRILVISYVSSQSALPYPSSSSSYTLGATVQRVLRRLIIPEWVVFPRKAFSAHDGGVVAGFAFERAHIAIRSRDLADAGGGTEGSAYESKYLS